MPMLLGNGFWHLVSQSDLMTKFVLFGLLVASIVCWTIVFYKIILFNQKQKELKKILTRLRQVHSLEELVLVANKHANTYPGQLLTNQLNHAKIALERSTTKERLAKEELVLDEFRFSEIEDMVHLEEQYLPVLSVTAAVSPLLGLFGTVWGLTHAFMSISQKQTADIIAIAPGVAEALLTTLGGLMVAIPVLIMYHYLRGQVDEIEFQLHKISEKVHAHVRITLLEGKVGNEISITPKKTTQGTIAS